jgi:aspartyl/asparaginyl beta-hydroxylase (cupin superfamily)
MQVGDERREWRNGKLMLFDTSVMHCAANEAAVDRYVLMLRVWHPGLSSFEIDALSWIFKCLDNPQLAAPPPTDWSNPGRPEPTPRDPAAAPRATSGMSRQARRQAEKKAKKSAKAKGGRGFG